MTDATERLSRVERALVDLRYARNDPTAPEYAAYNLLLEYAIELRAQTPKEIGRVLAAMTDQVNRARRHKAQHGSFDPGHERTLCEGLCGRWWATIENALRK